MECPPVQLLLTNSWKFHVRCPLRWFQLKETSVERMEWKFTKQVRIDFPDCQWAWNVKYILSLKQPLMGHKPIPYGGSYHRSR